MSVDPTTDPGSPFAEAISPTSAGDDTLDSQQQGYPLVSLFILVALCAVLLGLVTPLGFEVTEGSVGLPQVILSSILGAIVLCVLGMMVGIYHHRRLRGVFLGAAVGGMLGIVAGPMFFISRTSFTQLLVTSLGGAALLLTVGAVVRFNSLRRKVRVGPKAPKPHPLDD